VKKEKEEEARRKKEKEEALPEVFIADVVILRKQLSSEIKKMDPWEQMLNNEHSLFSQRQTAESALRQVRA